MADIINLDVYLFHLIHTEYDVRSSNGSSSDIQRYQKYLDIRFLIQSKWLKVRYQVCIQDSLKRYVRY